jgi:predicted nucleotidyltransferase
MGHGRGAPHCVVQVARLSGGGVFVRLESHRRGRRYSDIDIGILSGEPLPTGLLAELREALEESHIIYTVDVVDLGEVSDAFRSRVISEGVRWNE